MADAQLKIQGADGSFQHVLLDTIDGENYSLPAYKLMLGGSGEEEGLLSTSRPLPVAVSSQPFLVDAFQRVSIAQPSTLFDSQFQYDLAPLLWEAITSSNGTIAHRPNECAARLSTTDDNGSTAALQTKQYFRYQPGKAQQVFMTFTLGDPVASVTRRAGYFDVSNGIYLEQNGTTDTAIVRRTYVTGVAVNNRVTQDKWNLDRLDGTGPSGLEIDYAASQILVIDLQFLGVGRVRVGFDIDGIVIWAHEFLNANNLPTVYMTTANLPVRYEQSAGSGASAATMDCICATVISSGGFEDERGYLFGSANLASITVANGTATALLGIRPAATFNGIANRTTIIPLDVSLVAGSNAILVSVLYNATLAGGTWAAVDSNSAVQANTTPTGVSGGIPIARFHVGANGQRSQLTTVSSIASRLPLVLDVAGANPIELAIVASGLGGTSDSYAAASWKELR